MKKILLLAIALLIAAVSYSQDTIRTLKDVTIYGVRSNKTSPISKSSVDRKTIQKTAIGQEIANILNQTPNVTFHADNGTPFGYTYFRLRGLDQTKINMTMNGAPLNDPEDQGLFLSNYPGFIDNVQSMEIQRGVGTSSNGVASFGGSINFMSPDGTTKGSNLAYTVGAFNSIRTSATYSSGLSKRKWALFSNTSYYETGGYKYGSGGNGRSTFLSGGYFGNDNIVKFTGFVGNSRNGMAWMSVNEYPTEFFPQSISEDPRTNYNKNDGWDNFTQSFLQVEYSRRLNDRLKIHLSGFFNTLNGGYDYLMESKKNLFLNSEYEGFISNLNYSTDNIKLDFGLSVNSYIRNHTYSQSFKDYYLSLPDPVIARDNSGRKNESSGYLKGSYKLGKLYLSGDLQFRTVSFEYSSEEVPLLTWNFFNPKAGLTYQFTSNTNAYFSAGLSHREPTRTYIFDGEFYTGSVKNNTESLVDYELGVNHFSKRLKLQGNLYLMNFNHEITPIGGMNSNGVPNTILTENSYRAGIELDAKYKLLESLTLSYNGAFNRTYVEDGVTSFEHIMVPRFNHNAKISFEKNGFLVEILSKTQSSSYLNREDTYTIGGFTKFDTNLGYTAKKYSVMLTVNNITSKTYYTNGNMMTNPSGYVGEDTARYLYVNPLINAFVTLKYIF
jgi:iron complex outermembrane receptor protein